MGHGHLSSMRSAHLFNPSFGIEGLRRLTVCFKFASKSEKSFVSYAALAVGRRNVNKRVRGKHAPAGNICFAKSFAFRRYRVVARCHRPTPGRRESPRARPCLRVWSIQMDCSVCRSACGLTRRETNPASAAGWRERALSRETRVVWNGRRGVQTTRVGIRATACSPDMLKHAIVLRPRRTRDVIREAGETSGTGRDETRK